MSEVFEVCETNFYKCIRQVQKGLKEFNNKSEQLEAMTDALNEATQEVSFFTTPPQMNKMEI